MLNLEDRMIAGSRFFMKKIASMEVILGGHSVFSRQCIKIPHIDKALITLPFLVDSYMAYIRKCTLSIVQPVQSRGKTTFALFGSSFPLLIFSGPEFSTNDLSQTAALRIEGGLLVQRNECDKGMFSLIIELVEEGVQIAVQVCDYCPLLLGGPKPSPVRKWIYRWTQAFFHRMIVSGFLCHLSRRLESGNS